MLASLREVCHRSCSAPWGFSHMSWRPPALPLVLCSVRALPLILCPSVPVSHGQTLRGGPVSSILEASRENPWKACLPT